MSLEKKTEPRAQKDLHRLTSSIRESLEAVLQSSRFRDAALMQALLTYIVEKSMSRQDDALKERIIGMMVFGRQSDYDTTSDPIVRSRVGLLRKRLAQFYESDESRACAIEISIPPGGYLASFLVRADTAETTGADATVERPPNTIPIQTDPIHAEEDSIPITPLSDRRSQGIITRRNLGLAGLLLGALSIVAWISVAHATKTNFDLFWGPILEGNKPVLIFPGTIPAYLPSASLAGKLASRNSANHEQPATVINLPSLAPGDVLTTNDVVAYHNGLASIGDIKAQVMIVELLSSHNKTIDFSDGHDLSFLSSGPQGSPIVLIGAISNSLTLYLTKDLPFYFDQDWAIRERGGQGRVWNTSSFVTNATGLNTQAVTPAAGDRLANPLTSAQTTAQQPHSGFGADSTATEDYAIVARLVDSRIGRPVVIIAGLQSCGNQAAAQLLTSPAQMKQLASIPRDALARKNIELVLHTNLVNGAPASVNIVTERIW